MGLKTSDEYYERLSNGKSENLVGFVDQLIDLVCSGIMRLEEQRRWDLSVTVTPRKEPHNEKGSTRKE